MKSIVILIVFAAMFICVGWFVGGIITPLFTAIGAAFSTAALIIAILQLRRKNNDS